MFDWRTYLAERSAALRTVLFAPPYDISPELYWSMAGNQERFVQLQRQYVEEMDKIVQQVVPIAVATSTVFVVDKDKIDIKIPKTILDPKRTNKETPDE